MSELLMLLCPLLGSALLSLPLDTLALPRTASIRSRSPLALLFHLASVANIAALLLLLTNRPWYAGLLALGLVGLLVVVSNAKYLSLREPLVFTDIALLGQTVRFPRLYLPFLGVGKIIILLSGLLALLVLPLLESALPHRPVGLLLLLSFSCIGLVQFLSPHLVGEPALEEDQARLGFFTTFVAYLLNGMKKTVTAGLHSAMQSGPFASPLPHSDSLPDLVLIQSESFFDARQLDSRINQHLLPQFDLARQQALQQGNLAVPAWGANTMRTEFAILSGLAESQMGYARYYPYAFLRRHCLSLASWLANAGYRCLALHPYHAAFFRRDKVFPLLGFHTFIDIAGFPPRNEPGPYVGDVTLGEQIVRLLQQDEAAPHFIMGITMENHGPLHLEQLEPSEHCRYHALGADAHWADLTAYLRHLVNTDAMLENLLAYLRQRERPTIVCFYGDHLPALPNVFDRLNFSATNTQYFIWHNKYHGTGICIDRNAAQLACDLSRLVKQLAK